MSLSARGRSLGEMMGAGRWKKSRGTAHRVKYPAACCGVFDSDILHMFQHKESESSLFCVQQIPVAEKLGLLGCQIGIFPGFREKLRHRDAESIANPLNCLKR